MSFVEKRYNHHHLGKLKCLLPSFESSLDGLRSDVNLTNAQHGTRR
jgi:hypothetical protein